MTIIFSPGPNTFSAVHSLLRRVINPSGMVNMDQGLQFSLVTLSIVTGDLIQLATRSLPPNYYCCYRLGVAVFFFGLQ